MRMLHVVFAVALLGITVASAQSRRPVAPKDELQANRELILERNRLGNAGEGSKAEELLSADFRHNAGTAEARSRTGLDAQRAAIEDLRRTFPDWRSEILELVAERDLVVVRTKVTGTHLGKSERSMNGGYYKNAPPTGKRFEVIHTHWYRIRDGKIVEHWASRDDLGLTRQLGLIPPPP